MLAYVTRRRSGVPKYFKCLGHQHILIERDENIKDLTCNIKSYLSLFVNVI